MGDGPGDLDNVRSRCAHTSWGGVVECTDNAARIANLVRSLARHRAWAYLIEERPPVIAEMDCNGAMPRVGWHRRDPRTPRSPRGECIRSIGPRPASTGTMRQRDPE